MYWDVTEIKFEKPRELTVRFADGLSGLVIIDPSFCSGVFEVLLDDDVVRQARVENGVVTWPNGLDLAPDTMYHEIQSSSDRRYILRNN
jgi:hypothetical protein